MAELAAQSEGQKSENENLRDLLSRLQKENVMVRRHSVNHWRALQLTRPVNPLAAQAAGVHLLATLWSRWIGSVQCD